MTRIKFLSQLVVLAIVAAWVLPASGANDELEKQLHARLASGEFGTPACAPVSSNMRPVDRGFDYIRFETIPGAHRVVVVPSSSGWRMAFGVPELTVFTQAEFYTMKESTFVTSDGVERPAREYRLTPKGFVAMARPGANCFDYLSYRSVELISDEVVPMPSRLSGLGAAYRVKYRPHRGERRTNDTHESTTDNEAKLMRKGKGKEARLSYGGHALMENRSGLCVDIKVRSALETETEAAKDMLSRQARKRVRPTTLGADKGYHTKDFVAHLRNRKIVPHIAQIEGRTTPGLDARTTRHAGYAISQRKRKRVEEIFGWMKAYGGLRRTMARGLARVQLHAYIVGAAYNLLRMSRLQADTG